MRVLCLVLCAACAPPIDAPEEVGALGQYLFTHFGDEDPRELAAGLANLAALLQNEDYSVPPRERSVTMPTLSADQLGGLAVPDGVSTEDQVAVAIAGESGFSLQDQVAIMVDPVQTCLESEITKWAGRAFLSDVDCFTNGDCDTLDTVTATRRELSVFLRVWYDQPKAYRRVAVERDDGEEIEVIVGRAWLESVFEGDSGGTSIDQQFHLDAYLEDGTDRTLRWFSMWSSISGSPIDDATYANLVVNGLEEALQFGEEYLGDEKSTCRHDRDAPKPERPR